MCRWRALREPLGIYRVAAQKRHGLRPDSTTPVDASHAIGSGCSAVVELRDFVAEKDDCGPSGAGDTDFSAARAGVSWWGEEVGEEVGGVAVGAGHGVGVDVDGGRGAGVAETLGDHRDRDTGGEHGRGHEVTQIVQPEVRLGKTGRVRLTTLTKEFFMPRFLERDECEREAPCEQYPWDGVRNVRPFSRFQKSVVEGVY